MLKTMTFAIMHVSVAFLVVGLMTGDWLVGGIAALVEPAVNTVAFYFHDRFWKRHEASAGQGSSAEMDDPSLSMAA